MISLNPVKIDLSTSFDVAIVGAGISGLVAGSLLIQNGYRVILLEKSKGIGGRLATRRMSFTESPKTIAYFDHGPQLLEISSEAAMQILRKSVGDEILDSWRFQMNTHSTAFRPLPTMNAVSNYFPAAENVLREKKVVRLRYEAATGKWTLHFENGPSCFAKKVVSTIPIPQFLDLIHQSQLTLRDDLHRQTTAVQYSSSIALLVANNERIEPIFLRNPHPSVDWIVNNQFKGISKDISSITVIASPEWSKNHFEDHDSNVFAELWGLCKTWTNETVKHHQIHRWKYSQPISTLSHHFSRLECFEFQSNSDFLICGDFFGDQNLNSIERAMISGNEVAQYLLSIST